MSTQSDIFEINESPVYCVDTCSFLNVLKVYGDEPYAMDVMEGVLEFLESKLKSGKIICPVAIYDELKKRESTVDGLKEWLKEYRHCFLELDDDQIAAMAPIVNKYDIYATDKGDYGDVAAIGFAKARKLTVVTSEVRKDQHKMLHPKVPNVCEEFDVECISVIELLRREGVKLKLEK